MQITDDTLTFGDIILINYPSSQHKAATKRPFLILKNEPDDLLSCFISSRIDSREQGDIILKKDNKNNLATSSVLKPRKLYSINKGLLYKKIGSLKPSDRKKVKEELIKQMKSL